MSGDAPSPPGLRRVHVIGIGGSGMAGIARLLLARGTQVSGSDARDSATVNGLRALGATVYVGHDPAHLGDAELVVVSSAIRETNPELAEARRRGLRVLHRAAALVEVMADRTVVAVAGTHGKTTTTSMLAVALQHCGADPSFYIGGELAGSGASGHEGSGSLFLAEVDESDRSFLLFAPDVAIVTNVEPDHVSSYGSLRALEDAFAEFVGRIRPGGCLVACVDDAGSRRLALRALAEGVEVVTYGTDPTAAVRVEGVEQVGVGTAFELVVRGRRAGRVELPLPGAHYALNAAAAVATGLRLGFAASELRDGLLQYAGTRRRFELKGEVGGVRVYDDYAHHPTEVDVTLRAARGVAGEGRVFAVLQPHRYSRTAELHREYAQSVASADLVVVMDVYAANEDPIPGVDGALVASQVPLPTGRVVYEPSWTATPATVARLARPGDVIITLGCGDVTLQGPEILEELRERVAAGSLVAAATSPSGGAAR